MFGRPATGDTCICDDPVESTERCNAPFHEVVCVTRMADITDGGNRPSAAASDLGGEVVEQLLTPGREEHCAPLRCECSSDDDAQARRGAGDDRRLPVQAKIDRGHCDAMRSARATSTGSLDSRIRTVA